MTKYELYSLIFFIGLHRLPFQYVVMRETVLELQLLHCLRSAFCEFVSHFTTGMYRNLPALHFAQVVAPRKAATFSYTTKVMAADGTTRNKLVGSPLKSPLTPSPCHCSQKSHLEHTMRLLTPFNKDNTDTQRQSQPQPKPYTHTHTHTHTTHTICRLIQRYTQTSATLTHILSTSQACCWRSRGLKTSS
jgi:hypothetical protein